MNPHVILTGLIHLFATFSLIFCPLFVALFWWLSIAKCFYGALVLSVISVVSLLLHRLRLPSQEQIAAFIGPTWPNKNIAHRGAGTEAPENTLDAFREARRNGASFVELDVALTKDGVPVILHDDTVDRTTDGSGAIKDLTLAEVSTLNSAAKHHLRDKFPQAHIPTLEEATMECLNHGLNIFFDVKDWSPKMVNVLTNLFKGHPELYGRGVVCSFYPQISYKVKHQDPAILTALTYCDHTVQYYFGCYLTGPLLKRCLCILADYLLVWCQYTWLWLLCGNAFTLVDKTLVSEDIVEYWNQRGIKTVVWTVNDPTEKDYFIRRLQCSVITDSVAT